MAVIAWLKQELILNSSIAFRRFAPTLLYAVIASMLSIIAIEQNRGDSEIYRYILMAALGVPLSFAISLYAERNELPGTWHLVAQCILVILLAAYMLLFLPAKPTISAIIRFALVALLSHAWVSFAAYPARSATTTFWQFNRTLFIRFAVSSLFAGVLYTGLIIALMSIDALLGIRIDRNRYPELFILCAGVIHPWFFLAGVPQSFETEVETYPAVLRVFAQYILIPLVAIYVVILYLYSAKVIIHWEWPRYKATYLVGLFSAPGILATLLLYPLSVSAWVKKYTRIFYLVLIPLVLMMLACVYRRVSEHGLTEMMVVAISMGTWLIFISLFMLKTDGEKIRTVPVTLVLILLVISFGPLSAPTLGQSSQTRRVREILLAAKVPDAKIVLQSKEIIKLKVKEYTELTNKVSYLTQHFGAAALLPFIAADANEAARFEAKSDGRRISAYDAQTEFIAHFENTEPEKGSANRYRYYAIRPQPLQVAGYAQMVRTSLYRQESGQDFALGDYKIRVDWKENVLSVEKGKIRGRLNFQEFYDNLDVEEGTEAESMKPAQLSRTFKFGAKKAKIYFMHISGEAQAREMEIVLLLP